MSIAITEHGDVTEIALDRAPLNALDRATVTALERAVRALKPTQCLVLTGRHQAFCAGVDTKLFAAASPAERRELVLAITRMTAALLAHPAPVVSAVNGHAVGGGLVLALCGDYRLAADLATLKCGLTEARAGVPFPAGAAAIIQHELPAPLLRRLSMTSAIVSAAELRALGVFDELIEPHLLVQGAHARARALAAQPGFVTIKRQVRGALAQAVQSLSDAGYDPFIDAFD